MALPDQLATQPIPLADERHSKVPAEANLVQGVGHELHPGAFCSHPETRSHYQDKNILRCAEHYLREWPRGATETTDGPALEPEEKLRLHEKLVNVAMIIVRAAIVHVRTSIIHVCTSTVHLCSVRILKAT